MAETPQAAAGAQPAAAPPPPPPEQAQAPPPPRRAVCAGCSRPASVCLCSSFPATPLRLRGACVVLQHPSEAKQKFATAPLLRRSLDPRDFAIERGRRFDVERAAPRLHALLRRAAEGAAPVLVLWPRAGVSVGLGRAMREEGARQPKRRRGEREEEEVEEGMTTATAAAAAAAGATAAAGTAEAEAAAGADGRPSPSSSRPLAYLLIAIDGTWVQAQEMSGPLARWISREGGGAGPARLVHLDAEERAAAAAGGGAGDGAMAAAAAATAAADGGNGGNGGSAAPPAIPVVIGDPALRWRTEPLAAGMSTCEAVARALEVCEAHAATAEEEEAEEEREEAGGGGAAAATAGAGGRVWRPSPAAAKEAAALRAALVAPLARLVAMQVKFDPAMRARTGLRPDDDAGAGAEGAAGAAAAAASGDARGGDGNDGAGNYVRASRRFRTTRRTTAGLPASDPTAAAE